MGIAYQSDGSVICTGNANPSRTAAFAGPANSTTQLAQVASFFVGDPPPGPTAGTLEYLVANFPTTTSSGPPAVSDSGDNGTTPLLYAKADHTHASKVRKERKLGISTATMTWTYPTPFASGIVPVCQAIVEDPNNVATDSYNVQVVGTPTNTSCVFRIIRTSVVLGVLGLNATPGTVNIHAVALQP